MSGDVDERTPDPVSQSGTLRQLTKSRTDLLASAIDFDGTLIVHVGTHKTGSTSIQAFCSNNYTALKAHGMLYPRSGRVNEKGMEMINHHPLMRSITGESISSTADQIEQLRAEIADAQPTTVIISSEILSRENLTAEPFGIIRDIFQAASRRWIIFLRWQGEYLVSRYAEMIKTQDVVWPSGIEVINMPLYLDHRLRLQKLQDAVNGDPITALSFDEVKRRVISAFFDASGVRIPNSLDTSYHRNPSLPWGTLNMMRVLNVLPRTIGRWPRSVALRAGSLLAGTSADFLVSWGRPLSKRQLKDMRAQYYESNKWVEEAYFAGRPVLNSSQSAKS